MVSLPENPDAECIVAPKPAFVKGHILPISLMAEEVDESFRVDGEAPAVLATLASFDERLVPKARIYRLSGLRGGTTIQLNHSGEPDADRLKALVLAMIGPRPEVADGS